MPTYLIDYGEVISQPQDPHSIDELIAVTGMDRIDFTANYWAFRPAYDAGQSANEYWKNVLAQSVPIDPNTLRTLVEIDIAGWMHFDRDSVAWIENQHRRGSKLHLLSNAPNELASAIAGSELARYFDQLIFSARLKMVKPNREIFSQAHSSIGGLAADIIFVDDRPENISAAEQYGMQAHLYVGKSTLANLADRD